MQQPSHQCPGPVTGSRPCVNTGTTNIQSAVQIGVQKNSGLALSSDHGGPIGNTVVARPILIIATEEKIAAGGQVFLDCIRIPGWESYTDQDR